MPRLVVNRGEGGLGRCRSGAAAAEFAMVLPVLLLLMFGTFQTAMLMYSYNTMVSVARDTTRAMAVCTITDLATATSTAQNNLNTSVPWVDTWAITPAINGDVSMTISVDPAKAAILSYIPFDFDALATTIVMRKEPLDVGAGQC